MERAVNPKTGEVVFLAGNEWVKPSETAKNDDGDMAYLVKNQWQVVKSSTPTKDERPSIGAPMGDNLGSSIMAASEAPKPEQSSKPVQSKLEISPSNSINAQDYLASVAKRKEENPDRSVSDVVVDSGITLLKAAIGLPESFVGLADIPTAGYIGKFLEDKGYKPKEAKAILDTYLSEAQQVANRKVGEAKGFGSTVSTLLQNPSVIATSAAESLPQMLGGAGIARKLVQAAPKIGAVAAGAAGEGILGAGSAAEQMRQESESGLLTGKQALSAVGSGLGTAAFGLAGGKIAKRLGLDDVDTMLAAGSSGGKSKSIIDFSKKAIGSGVSEGVFEEMPQSAQEKMWMNYATDKPVMEGVAEAMGSGLVTGSAMGMAGTGAGHIAGSKTPPPPPGSSASYSAPSNSPVVAMMTVNVGGKQSIKTTHEDGSVDIDGVQIVPPTNKSETESFGDLSKQRDQELQDLLAPANEPAPAPSVTPPVSTKAPAAPSEDVQPPAAGPTANTQPNGLTEERTQDQNDVLELEKEMGNAAPEKAATEPAPAPVSAPTLAPAPAPIAVTPPAITKAEEDFSSKPPEEPQALTGEAKPNEAKAITAPVEEDIPLADEEFAPFGEEDLTNKPAPERPEVQELLDKAEQANKDIEALSKRTAGTSLMKVLQGSLQDSEMSELGGRSRQIGKNPFISLVAKKGKPGSSMEDMVDSGALDLFLPEKMRPSHPMYDNLESAAYIREKLIQGQYYTNDTQMAIDNLTQGVWDLDKLIQEELSIDDINKEIEQAFAEQREADLNTEKTAPSGEAGGAAKGKGAEAANDELDKREAQLEREAKLNEREAQLLEERKRLEEERLKLEGPTKEDVADQEERKAKAAELDEKAQIKKESEAGAGQFELTREEGRQDTTGNLFNQPAPEPEVVEVSPEQEKKEALSQFEKTLAIPVPMFRSQNVGKTQILKPAPLSKSSVQEIVQLASDAIDLGLPPVVLGNVIAAGSTRMKAGGVMSEKGWLMTGSQWKELSSSGKLHTLIHELAHSVDFKSGEVSKKADWAKARAELQNWYAKSADKFRHPFKYPFASHYKGKVDYEMESFAEAFAYYFTLPKDLQKNAPEAYSQIQTIVERINNGSQAARTAGARATNTAGIKIQPSRSERRATVQPDSGAVGTAVSGTKELEDRSAGKVNAAVEFREDIPNEYWLKEKIDYALESPRNRFGVPKMSSLTGYFTKPVLVPTRWLKNIKGESGEQENVRQSSLSAIRKIIRETGKMPISDDGTEYVPYIEIGYDGKPWISEGNHRIMAAIAEGMEYIPIELRYFDGGQRRAGVWGPGNVASITERVEGERAVNINASIDVSKTNTPAFERWFGDSKIVSGGEPLLMYTGTSKDKDFTKFNIPRNGAWFTSDPESASQYAKENDSMGFKWEGSRSVEINTASRVLPVYLRIENPYTITDEDNKRINKENYKRAQGQFFDELRAKGYDGVDFGHGIFVVLKDPNQIKSAIGNNGEYGLKTQQINASIGQTIFGKAPLVNWTTPDQTSMDQAIKYLADKHIDTKRVIEAIESTAGKIADAWNPYLKEETFHGRSAKQTKDFLNHELTPLMNEMRDLGVSMEELQDYLHNRHAQESNDQMAAVNPNLQDNGSGIKTADAQKYLANLSQDQLSKYKQLAKMVDSITSGTRQLLVDSGLESQDTIDKWEETYKHYVPLNRDDVDYTSNHGMSVGQGYSVKGPASRRAVGSERKVIDILANIAMQRERNIVRAEKNRVAIALYGLALKNSNPKFWLAVNPDAKKNIGATVNELVDMGFMPSDVRKLMEEPRKTEIDPRTGLVREVIHQIGRGADNVMSIRVNGENRYVFFNQNNDRANSMVRSLKNLDADQLGPVLSNMALATRYIASVNTQYNPVFGTVNFTRDVQGAMLQLSTTEIAGEQKAVSKNIMPAMLGIYQDLRLERKGKIGRGQWSRLWEDFQQHGGQTGFRDQFSRSEDRGIALQKIIDPSSWADSKLGKIFSANGKLTVPIEVARKSAAPIFNWLSDYNETMENAVRLSAYKVALDKGFSKDKAASIAKNLTVNFNRKGDVATQAGALYAFFNASVQGTARLAQTLAGPAGKAIIGGGLFLGVLEGVMMSMAGFGDDDPPDFVKEKNFIIPIFSTGKYIAVPVALGYNVIPNFSRLLTEATIRHLEGKPVKAAETTFKIFDSLLGAFNPIGNAGWSFQTFAPTVADPLVALGENKDWTGKKIAREDFNSLHPTPGYLRAKESASTFGRVMSKFINSMSGGTADVKGSLSPTPDQIDYLVGQATGGVGRELMKFERAGRTLATGEELPSHALPIVGRFYGDTKESSSVANHFYSNLVKMNAYEDTIKGMRSRKENVQMLFKENPEARAHKYADEVERDVQKLRKKRHSQVEKGAPKEEIKATEARITAHMKRLNDKIESYEKKRLTTED